METITLNLARKWRSKSFDQIVGQDLSVRMLKNSLFLGQYFPVYLLSGQRGCGKTTTARVFAAAVNCEQLETFQKNPKQQLVPCLACASCTAMLQGKHPDFIEIDAASHTGVDNIRQIIDAASFLPLMGRKKIYLIDEAHMLSKAAFNALLKIMEEPPASVLFMLATTDTDKIIETIRSRCFQLFFGPVKHDALYNHLEQVCISESIKYTQEGLGLIIRESEGSVRDALNLIEQVRFSSSAVSKENVLKILGYVDDEQIVSLFETIVLKGPQDLITFLDAISFNTMAPDVIWRRLVEVIRATLWIKYKTEPSEFLDYTATLKRLAQQCSVSYLAQLLHALYDNESLFLKTKLKHACFEMILLQMLRKKTDTESSGSQHALSSMPEEDESEEFDDEEDGGDEDEQDEYEEEVLSVSPLSHAARKDQATDMPGLPAWDMFLTSIEEINDPLLSSVMKQARFIKYDTEKAVIDISFPKNLLFFKDVIYDAHGLWHPYLEKLFEHNIALEISFNEVQSVPAHESIAHNDNAMPASSDVSSNNEQSKLLVSRAEQSSSHARGESNAQPKAQGTKTSPFNRTSASPKKELHRASQAREHVVAISDAEKWPLASELLQHFPGVITEIKEDS